MDIRIFDDKEEWIQAIVGKMIRCIDVKTDACTIGLSGGKTPRPIYEALARQIKNPEKLHLYTADERYVPLDHPESNYGMINESLLAPHRKTIGSFHYIDTSLPLEEAVEHYNRELKNLPEDFFDILFLGIGPDGHILSLFPHTDGVQEYERAVIHTTTDQFTIPDRITLTSRYVCNAKYIILVASGPDKFCVIEDLKAGKKTVDDSPVMMVQHHPHLDIFYLR